MTASRVPWGPSNRLDESALDRLYTEHGRVLLADALRRTGDAQLAEDLVQETLLRAWTHPTVMSEDTGRVRAWLLTVSRNLARDHFRARASRPQEVGGDALAAASDDASDDIELALQSWVVTDALSELSADHRAVLVATFYEGLSVRQAAERLGIPEGTVKSRCYYALRSLRASLARQGVIR